MSIPVVFSDPSLLCQDATEICLDQRKQSELLGLGDTTLLGPGEVTLTDLVQGGGGWLIRKREATSVQRREAQRRW